MGLAPNYFALSARDRSRVCHKYLGYLKCILKNETRGWSISEAQLLAFRIHLSTMSLVPNDGDDSAPDFCTPFPAEEFDKLYQRLTERPKRWVPCEYSDFGTLDEACSVSTFLAEHLSCNPFSGETKELSKAGYWTAFTCTSTKGHPFLKDYDCRASGQWETLAILHSFCKPSKTGQEPVTPSQSETDKSIEEEYAACGESWLRKLGQPLPHIGCILINDMPFVENVLFRSEAIAAVSLMRNQLCLKRNIDHGIIPVYVYSFSGFRGRILECSFEVGPDLFHMRMTPIMNIDDRASVKDWEDKAKIDENEGNIKLMLRWMLNIPKGDTLHKDLPADVRTAPANEASLTPKRSPLAPKVNPPLAEKDAPTPTKTKA